MKFEHTQVMNFEGSFRGLRNPKNSWNKSDSLFDIVDVENSMIDYAVAEKWMNKYYSNLEDDSEEYEEHFNNYDTWLLDNGILRYNEDTDIAEVAFIGPNDMKLAQTLVRSGSEHRKFLRQIFVSVDITAPLYWWKEADTYKVATVANSTSTMHKLTSKPITIDCFEIDDYNKDLDIFEGEQPYTQTSIEDEVINIINFCEELRQKYLETKDTRYWKELVRWLPESWLQTRTWTANYETILSICHQRRSHKLNEWSGIHTQVEDSFIQWARTLPYAQEFLFFDETTEQVL
ncbi:MAG: hypothetical protein LIO71_02815 [Ruminococcus sp.]|nr:hypothetical protein [Ruminococcus sp.]